MNVFLWVLQAVLATMLGAAATHVRRKEPAAVAVNVVLLALTALIAWGRF
ncbi:DoxX family protein [Nonomuraea sp. NPDC003707]